MKKNKSILIIIVLFICLFLSVLVIKQVYKNDDKLKCADFSYEEMLVEINSALNYSFIEESNMTLHIPLFFSDDADYMFAINEQSQKDYFIIIKNPSKEDDAELMNFVEFYSDLESGIVLEVKKQGEYSYLVSSDASSTIEGIIRSFINCN